MAPIGLVTCTLLVLVVSVDCNPTPVVMWHGMGDTADGLEIWKVLLKMEMPDIYVHSVSMGKDEDQDMRKSFLSNINRVVAKVCTELANDKKLANGYNAIGFSQGSQFLRAVAERCPYPPMKKLISFGGQHQGVFGLPEWCSRGKICAFLEKLAKRSARIKFLQKRIVQAAYWHDPIHENEYRRSKNFISDINNEGHFNQTYQDNLLKLEKLVLVKFLQDSMVIPLESQWFGFYAPGQKDKVVPYYQTRLYTEDRIGLKELVEDGRVDFLSIDGDHLNIDFEWFIKKIIKPYLRN